MAFLAHPLFHLLMIGLSLFLLYENLSELFPSKRLLDELKKNELFMQNLSSNVILIGTFFVVMISIGYVLVGRLMGLLPIKATYAIVVFQMVTLFFGHMVFSGILKRNWVITLFEQLYRGLAAVLSVWYIVAIMFSLQLF